MKVRRLMKILMDVATNIIAKYPDYAAFTNNCQNFVLYLLQYACHQPHTMPKPVGHIVRDLWLSSKLTHPISDDRVTLARICKDKEIFMAVRTNSTPQILLPFNIDYLGFYVSSIAVVLF